MACPALCSRDDVVNRQILRLEVLATTIAVSALFPIKFLLVNWVIVSTQDIDIRSLRNIGSVCALIE